MAMPGDSNERSRPDPNQALLIRAVGPSLALAPFNVAGAMADPRLDLFSGPTVIHSSYETLCSSLPRSGRER